MNGPQPDFSAFGRAARDAFATGRTYVEGYVIIGGEPFEHAWTVDAKGMVHDSTIARNENVSGYFGVPFSRDYVAKALLENKGYAILGADARTRRRLVIGKDADFKEADHPRDADGKFGSGGGNAGPHSMHVEALRAAGLNDQKKFADAFEALKADKNIKNADLKKIIEEYTAGKIPLGKNREQLLDQIYKDWVRSSRFENKIKPAGDESLALDRASVREIDQDGRLGVEITNISKANVCPYLGREIPGAEQLRLDPERIYQLLRDPEELRKAAPTFCNLPVLSRHVPVFAEDYAEQAQQYVVGATGSDCVFEAPYLRCSLKIWDGPAIAAIQSGEQKELSCGYHYTPDMTPGLFDGAKYDGVMREIRGNHVSLVHEGRAGADVVVADFHAVHYYREWPNLSAEIQWLQKWPSLESAFSF